ncbi:MAG TPA: GH25 family lysozyme [Polyangiaceae bacterium]|jgi:lysozyme
MRSAWLWGFVVLAACSSSGNPAEPTATTSEELQQCETVSVEGVDVASGQGAIDWTSVKGDGVDFAIMKATQGTYYTASTFAADWSGSKTAGVLRSPYHFFDPTEDGALQAQFFLSVVGTLGAGDLPAMLDIECPTGSADTTCLGNGMSDAASGADIATRMWAFIDAVESATGKKPLIYTYGSYFTDNGVDTTGLDAYPLYIADPVTGSCFNVPAPWTAAVMWQYSWTGTVTGISGDVDRDKFIGNLAALQELAQTTVAVDAGPDAGSDASTDSGAPADTGTGPDAHAVGGEPSDHLDSGGAAAGDAGSWDQGAPSKGSAGGCGCRVDAARGAGGAWLGAALFALAGVWRRRHRSGLVLAGRSKEHPPCRRPTSAKA